MAEPVWFLTSLYKYDLIVPQINKTVVLIKIVVFINFSEIAVSLQFSASSSFDFNSIS